MDLLAPPVRLIWVALALLALPPTAFAASATGLSFEAPAECGGESEFVSAVESRGGRFAVVQSSRPAMAVSIHKTEAGFVGTFRVQGAAERSVPREVRGSSCGEVIDALAVVTAIALHPESEREPSATPAQPASEVGQTPRPETSLHGLTEKQFKGSSAWAGDSVQMQAGSLRFDPKLAWTFYYGATLGPVPSATVPSLGLSFHLADFVTTPDGHQRIVGPILWGRLGLSAPPGASYRAPGTTTGISSQSMALGVCWSPLYDTRGLVLLGCFESGLMLIALETKATDGSKIQSKNGGFGTAGPLIDVEYNLGSWLHLGAKFGANAIMGKVSAERADGSEIFHSRSWSLVGALGVGAHF